MMVGEVGDGGQAAIDIMAAYTEGCERLHMCYSFEMLSPEFTARHFRRVIEGVREGSPHGHSCWSFSNHDVIRHASRWAAHGKDTASLARQAIAMLASFPGTLCIYQGEELGQTETELVYEELTDPPALRFWPEIKGRDGCRTPMVWERDAPNAGFSEVKPWLPVKPEQAGRAVDGEAADPGSVLNAYREVLGFRRQQPALRWGDVAFIDLPEPLLAFTRAVDGQAVTCVFNLSKEPAELKLAAPSTLLGTSEAVLKSGSLHLPANGFAWLAGEGLGLSV
jgi:alpha-glucosidase